MESRYWKRVDLLLREDWSRDQIAGSLQRTGDLAISHETIRRYVWADRAQGGDVYRHLRCATPTRRPRCGRCDSRGRLASRCQVSERPAAALRRGVVGRWEIDTVMGTGNDHYIVTLVERATGVKFYFATPYHSRNYQTPEERFHAA